MKALLRIIGPNLNREVVLDPAGAELTLGRDAAADVQLNDPQKHISRKHLALRQVGDAVELRIVSALNGVETSRGTANPGQVSTLASGDHFTLGPYRVEVGLAAIEPARPAAAPGFAAEDPFAALLGMGTAAPPSDDPFARPEFRPAPNAPPQHGPDPFDQLTGSSSSAGGAGDEGPFGKLLGPGIKTTAGPGHGLADSSAQLQFGQPASGASIDSWLTGSSAAPSLSVSGQHSSGPLDSFLQRAAPPVSRMLSPDHVHGIHMPFSFGPTRPPEAPPQPVPSTPPLDDMWASLVQDVIPHDAASQRKLPERGPLGPLPSEFPPTPVASAARDPDSSFVEDPFDEWPVSGSQPLDSQAIAPDAHAQSPLSPPANATHAADSARRDDIGGADAWSAFARGLGLSQTHPADEKTAEHVGAMVRLIVEGLAELLGARADLKRELRAEDRTMLSGRDNNPVKSKLSPTELVNYLFAAQSVGAYMPAERAIRESIAELRVHEHATIAASRAAVQGALRDFEPGKLRKQLSNGKTGIFQLFDNAKLWEAYEQHYEKQSQHMADWLEAVFARHFMPTYSRETERLKIESIPILPHS